MRRHLIVGLGNPGPRYARNRHNIGYIVVDHLAGEVGTSITRTKFHGLFTTTDVEGQAAALLKPQTYMNASGRSVSRAVGFYEVAPENLLVIHDELDLPLGRMKLKIGGGHAGHKGIRSIMECLGHGDFCRLRIGIGRPHTGSVTDFVLGDFATEEERAALSDMVDKSVSAIRALVREGAHKAMNQVNTTD